MKILVVLFSALFFIPSSFAQTENLDPMRPTRLHEGKMFSLKLTPAGKKLDILVTGKKAATVNVSDLGVTASLFANGKTYTLVPKKQKEGFSLDLPVEAKSKLKLDLKYKGDSEKFDIPLD